MEKTNIHLSLENLNNMQLRLYSAIDKIKTVTDNQAKNYILTIVSEITSLEYGFSNHIA